MARPGRIPPEPQSHSAPERPPIFTGLGTAIERTGGCMPLRETLSSSVYGYLYRNKHTTPAYPEIVAACCQDCLVSMEFLFLGNQGDIAEDAVTSLLIQRCQDTIIVRFRVAEPLACQHFLNTTKESNHINTLPLTSPCHPRASSPLQHQCGRCGSQLATGTGHSCSHFLLSAPLLPSFSLILSFPHPLRVSFSFLLVLLFLNLCFGVCPSVSVYWPMSVSL